MHSSYCRFYEDQPCDCGLAETPEHVAAEAVAEARRQGRAEAFAEVAAEAERRAAEIDAAAGREMPVEAAAPLGALAEWARGRA